MLFCCVLAHARIRCPVRRRHAALTYAELEEVPDDARAFEQCGKMFLLRPVPELKESLAEAVESGNKDATALVEKTKHVEETYKKLQEDFNEFLKAHSALLPQPCRAAPLHAKPCVRSPPRARPAPRCGRTQYRTYLNDPGLPYACRQLSQARRRRSRAARLR